MCLKNRGGFMERRLLGRGKGIILIIRMRYLNDFEVFISDMTK
jgi:hypothetical protein